VPGKDNAVAIELISTHIQRQLESRSRHFRRKMAESLSLKPSMSKEPLREPSVEELGLTVLEQTPQLKVALILARVNDVALMSYRAFTPSYAIERQLDKISSSSLIVWQLYWSNGLWKSFPIEKLLSTLPLACKAKVKRLV